MKKYILFLVMIFCLSSLKAQKPNIQLDTYKKWTKVTSGQISNDGKYATYQINNLPIGSQTLVLCATKGSFKMEFKGLGAGTSKFTDNGNYFITKLTNDTLLLFDLKRKKQQKIYNIRSFEFFMQGNRQYMACIDTASNLILHSFNKLVQTFDNVLDYKLNDKGDKIIIKKLEFVSNKLQESLVLVDLITKQETLFFNGYKATSFVFDDSSNQIAFITANGETNLWYYRIGMQKAIRLSEAYTFASDKNYDLVTGEFWGFSKNGKRLFFNLKQMDVPKVKTTPKGLELSSYQDVYLRGYYNTFKDNPLEYLAIINIETKDVRQLTKNYEKVITESFHHDTDSIILISSFFGDTWHDWDQRSSTSYFICNSNTGKLKPLELNVPHGLPQIELSPTGKYIVYFDPKINNYCSYSVCQDKKFVLTNDINDTWVSYDMQDYPMAFRMVVGIAGWLPDDKGVLISSTYDIWEFDLANKKQALNLTLGQGLKTNTIFKPHIFAEKKFVGEGGKIILTAFNLTSKDFGFYEINLPISNSLKKLSMNPFFTGTLENGYSRLDNNDFLMSKYSNSYIIKFQQSTSAPNYYFSTDLVKFTPISNQQPQTGYNWLTTELHSYKDSLGNDYQGVLYKPENFDSTLSYPVIFHYYVRKSNLLNTYPGAELSGGSLNISLMVSNGYLVFLPDIKSKVKYSGDGAVLSVDAAANHLSKFKWVNKERMGIMGGSFGGYETNYIVTHSTRYAAAVSGAGMSDMVAFASGTWGWGDSQQTFAQYTGLKMESTLGDDPETYIRNSAILSSQNVVTPLLLRHNAKDNNVSYLQSRSFFIVLRNLQKRVWWLNYKEEEHGLGIEENQIDYSIRLMGFFDHYLKDKPMPKWMKKHI